MAENALFRIPRMGPNAEQRRRDGQHRRRSLRIAIRQLERAELYLDSLESLELDDREVEVTVRDIVARMKALRRYLGERRATA